MSDMEHTSERKKQHIDLCLREEVDFKIKTNGFEYYDFEHYAVTELTLDKIKLKSKLFGKTISYPFLISCMTGGTHEAITINEALAEAAAALNIPVGVGSMRQALENEEYHSSFRIIRKKAPDVPVIGNIGAAQLPYLVSNQNKIKLLKELIQADCMAIHLNPLQELVQRGGEPDFTDLLKNIEKLVKIFGIPIIVKEVGAGISRSAARKLLDAGAGAIDVAGAGGTSWAGVEYLRNSDNEIEFWDWGLPTTFCIKEIKKLKKKYFFTLIASGGIRNGSDIAKSIALGADIAASAKPLLIAAWQGGAKSVINLITGWFDTVRKIMYLTNCRDLKELSKVKLLKKIEMY